VVVRAAKGRYVLPSATDQLRAAQSRSAVLSHLSAAVHHGWRVKTVPADTWITVPRKRHLTPDQLEGACPRWADLAGDVTRHGVTTPLRTVLDRARALPFDEALAVADSALRARDIEHHELVEAAARLRGTGPRAARRVARQADGRAANPFESVLRALCLDEGFDLTPQLPLAEPGLYAVVDLRSEELRLAVEADGFEHHGTRKGQRRDCRRHTELSVFAWSSLRFTFEDVMGEQDWVRWALRSGRDVREGRMPATPPSRSRRQASPPDAGPSWSARLLGLVHCLLAAHSKVPECVAAQGRPALVVNAARCGGRACRRRSS
jgi:very-short-patch-repair endonuclease